MDTSSEVSHIEMNFQNQESKPSARYEDNGASKNSISLPDGNDQDDQGNDDNSFADEIRRGNLGREGMDDDDDDDDDQQYGPESSSTNNRDRN